MPALLEEKFSWFATRTRRSECAVAKAEREEGAELVEFAFVVAMLMVLLLAIVAFARAYNVYQSITRAAREGARMAVLPSSYASGDAYMDGNNPTESSSAVFSNYISPVLQAANLDPAKVSNYNENVQWLDPGDTDQQCGVVISFQYPYTFYIPFTSLNLTTINLTTQVQMRRENQPLGSSATCP